MQQFQTSIVAILIPSSVRRLNDSSYISNLYDPYTGIVCCEVEIPSTMYEAQVPLLTTFAHFVFLTGNFMPRTIMADFLGLVPDTRLRLFARSLFVLPNTMPATINEDMVGHAFARDTGTPPSLPPSPTPPPPSPSPSPSPPLPPPSLTSPSPPPRPSPPPSRSPSAAPSSPSSQSSQGNRPRKRTLHDPVTGRFKKSKPDNQSNQAAMVEFLKRFGPPPPPPSPPPPTV
ncbi:uncharacterized protein EV154DRAFT_569991 [Mucor mucedo]|uniref:uncharacterized protein n=1 Tax=Mucor mucedo TaxID=29922 RepID=UPI00221FE0A2|nr:uncharacterized protein EV154DRAFT_569991 [Mucor mucedo]KAI7873564.1 hypothetical protein EV154DRAFT_569991 [Mucor mucedo]